MPQPTQSITLVSGLPRSGTSLMMRMLRAGGMAVLADGVRQADEDNPEGYLELEAVKRTRHDQQWLGEARGKAVKVVCQLLRDLPQQYSYRVIFMRRDLRQVVASQQLMLDRRGEAGAGLPSEEMIRVLQAELDRTLAWLAGQENFNVLQVDYVQTIGDAAEVAGQVVQFLSSSLDEKAMSECVRPELYRQRHA
jgi:hypothetical protein